MQAKNYITSLLETWLRKTEEHKTRKRKKAKYEYVMRIETKEKKKPPSKYCPCATNGIYHMLNHLTFSHKPKFYTNTAKISIAVWKCCKETKKERKKCQQRQGETSTETIEGLVANQTHAVAAVFFPSLHSYYIRTVSHFQNCIVWINGW